MPSLKDYRNRIASVKSTRKITSAMKMVAASKLKKAQEAAEAAQPYAAAMSAMMARLSSATIGGAGLPLLQGTGSDRRHLLIVVTADRGLCGGFNGNAVRVARATIRSLLQDGKDVKIVTVGRKARDLLRRDFASHILQSHTAIGGKGRIAFAEALSIAGPVLESFARGEFDVCTLIFNDFKSVLRQTPTVRQLIPFEIPESAGVQPVAAGSAASVYTIEPDGPEILESLLPRNIATQIYRALLDSAAGEQAARMTAMDNATRNAGDMISRLSIQYNRARQAFITKELIEIISGAEAV